MNDFYHVFKARRWTIGKIGGKSLDTLKKGEPIVEDDIKRKNLRDRLREVLYGIEEKDGAEYFCIHGNDMRLHEHTYIENLVTMFLRNYCSLLERETGKGVDRLPTIGWSFQAPFDVVSWDCSGVHVCSVVSGELSGQEQVEFLRNIQGAWEQYKFLKDCDRKMREYGKRILSRS